MRKNIILTLVTIILTLTALEAGWRVYVANYGTLRQKVLYLYTREEIDALELLYRALPFVNFGLSPIHEDINSLGYRGREIISPKPAGSYRIVAMGASTTYGGFLDRYEQAYPYKLQLELTGDYGYTNAEVINAGVPGYTSWETAVNFMFRVQALDPNLIIIYHGYNDITPRLVDPAQYNGGYESRGVWDYPDEDLPFSALQRLLMHKLGNSIRIAYSLGDRMRTAPDIRGCGLDLAGAVSRCAGLDMAVADVLSANPPRYFERNLDNIISMAAQRGIDVLLLTWAYSPYDYETASDGGMTLAFRQGQIALHNDILRRLAAERDTYLYDLAAAMPADREYWHNGIHMTEKGTTEMARQLAGYLASAGVLGSANTVPPSR